MVSLYWLHHKPLRRCLYLYQISVHLIVHQDNEEDSDDTDKNKATFQFLSESKSMYSWDHCPENAKEAMLGMMAVNNLAESLFAGVTWQVLCFGRVDVANAAAVSDLGRNKFLSRDEPGER